MNGYNIWSIISWSSSIHRSLNTLISINLDNQVWHSVLNSCYECFLHECFCYCNGPKVQKPFYIRLVACIGSGDPVRVLRLYTTNTLDEVCSIYCWDICTTCRYRSTCYSTGASGPTVLSVCSRLCLVANCWTVCPSVCLRTVLYDAFYSYLCRRYWNGILGPSKRNERRLWMSFMHRNQSVYKVLL